MSIDGSVYFRLVSRGTQPPRTNLGITYLYIVYSFCLTINYITKKCDIEVFSLTHRYYDFWCNCLSYYFRMKFELNRYQWNIFSYILVFYHVIKYIDIAASLGNQCFYIGANWLNISKYNVHKSTVECRNTPTAHFTTIHYWIELNIFINASIHRFTNIQEFSILNILISNEKKICLPWAFERYQ